MTPLEEFKAKVAQGAPHEAALMLTELIGYDSLLAQAPDRARELFEAHAAILKDCVSRSPGILVKATGASHLVEFPASVGAARCALDIQFRVAARNAGTLTGDRLAIRIGLHYAAVTPEAGDLKGDGLELLTHLGPKVPEVGGICITQVTLDGLRDKPGFQFDDLGLVNIPGIQAPEHLYLISIAGGPARSTSKDSLPSLPRPPVPVPEPRRRFPVVAIAAVVGFALIGGAIVVMKGGLGSSASAPNPTTSAPVSPPEPPAATPSPASASPTGAPSTTPAPSPAAETATATTAATPEGSKPVEPPPEPQKADEPSEKPPAPEATEPPTTLERLQQALARVEKLPKARQKKLLPDLKQWKAVEQAMRSGKPGAKVNLRILARLEKSLDSAESSGASK